MFDEYEIGEDTHECICLRSCHTDHESERHVHYIRGDIAHFVKCPPHFSYTNAAMNTRPETEDGIVVETDSGAKNELFSFADATEEILLASDYDLKELKKYCETNYGILIHANTQKTTAVSQFVTARYNSIGVGSAGMEIGKV